MSRPEGPGKCECRAMKNKITKNVATTFQRDILIKFFFNTRFYQDDQAHVCPNHGGLDSQDTTF